MTVQRKPVMTMSHQVYQILREDIVSGVYKPNDWLQEKELAAKLEVSRSPVREALRLLAADGLVREIPNKGMFVRAFTPKEITEIFEVRTMLESHAIRALNGRVSDEQKEQFRQLRNDLSRFHRENDLEQYIETDSAFHRYLVECTGNSILIDLYRKVRTMNMLFRIFSLSTKERFDESQEEHAAIINALLSDDTETAVSINNRHLELAKDTAIAHIPFEKSDS